MSKHWIRHCKDGDFPSCNPDNEAGVARVSGKTIICVYAKMLITPNPLPGLHGFAFAMTFGVVCLQDGKFV